MSDENSDKQRTLRSARFGNFRFGETWYGHDRVLNRIRSGANYGARLEPITATIPPRADRLEGTYTVAQQPVEAVHPTVRDADGAHALETAPATGEYDVQAEPLAGDHRVRVNARGVVYAIEAGEAVVEYDIEADGFDAEYAIERAVTAVYDLVDETIDVGHGLRADHHAGEYDTRGDRLTGDHGLESDPIAGEILDTRATTASDD